MSLISMLPGLAVASSTACLLPLSSRRPGRRSRLLSCKCKARAGDELVDRRDVLLGLTGLAAASNLGGGPALAADAVCAEDVTAQVLQCTPPNENDIIYCPSASKTVIPFTSEYDPKAARAPRMRRPAHLLGAAEVAKFEYGIKLMKALPDKDPRSFARQQAIHAAYCDSHYSVLTKKDVVAADGSVSNEIPFDVHFSSIFAPWHRMYIYFFEKIIGELVGDESFALPYWNWDAPDGMGMPAMFMDKGSPLHHSPRNPDEKLQAFMDLNLGPALQSDLKGVGNKCTTETYGVDCRQVKNNNLYSMYRQMNVDSPTCFHGSGFCAGGKKASGSLENGGHTAGHIWVGGHMGVLSTAAQDPIFYCNHSNVDRLWHLWRTQLGHADPMDDQKWLKTSFVFYDHKQRPVRITVNDVLDVKNLGYTYERKPRVEWLDMRPKPASGVVRTGDGGPLVPRLGAAGSASVLGSTGGFPLYLVKGENRRVKVTRPEQARSGGLLPQEAVLVDMTVDPCEEAVFTVLVNVPEGQENKVGPNNSEYVGRYAQVPHGGGGAMKNMQPINVSHRFRLGELMRDLKTTGDSTLTVTFVPVEGKNTVINAIKVEALC